MPLRRYKCPHCSSALERTIVHPEWLSLEATKPDFQMPLFPILGAIVVLGLGLAFIHPVLSLLAIYLFAHWLYWRYYSYLQCGSCQRFYFGGQFSGKPHETVAWTRRDIRTLAAKFGIAGAIFGTIFTPLYALEVRAKANCKKECAIAGTEPAMRGFKCECLPAFKPPTR
jgi:hypothetical protein